MNIFQNTAGGQKFDQNGRLWVTAMSPLFTYAVPAGVGTYSIGTTPAVLWWLDSVLITTTGTAGSPILIYDNASAASGTVIGYIPGTAAAGTVYSFKAMGAFGIFVNNLTGGPAFTVSYA